MTVGPLNGKRSPCSPLDIWKYFLWLSSTDISYSFILEWCLFYYLLSLVKLNSYSIPCFFTVKFLTTYWCSYTLCLISFVSISSSICFSYIKLTKLFLLSWLWHKLFNIWVFPDYIILMMVSASMRVAVLNSSMAYMTFFLLELFNFI